MQVIRDDDSETLSHLMTGRPHLQRPRRFNVPVAAKHKWAGRCGIFIS